MAAFFTGLESLAVQLGGLKAAVATGPAELFLGLPSLGKAKHISPGDVGEQHTRGRGAGGWSR